MSEQSSSLAGLRRILSPGECDIVAECERSGINRRRGTEVGDAREAWDIPEGPGFPRIAMAPPASSGQRSPRAVATAQPSIASTPSIRNGPMILFGMMNAGVAGAQMSTITKDFSEAFGLAVTSGVMVNNAPLGSLAYESGLRDADIITKVGGRIVRTVLEVRQLVELASNDGARSVDVDILRQKKAQRIVLKW